MRNFKKNIYRTTSNDSAICLDCVYNEVNINGQIWTGCNANTAFYSNGDPIPEVTDPTAWASLTTGAWCWYNNDPANGPTYGKLYNWYAVNDPRGLAPTGYHVPTDAEWTALTTFLGGLSVAGSALRETGICHWEAPNTGATNTSLFSAIGGGVRISNGTFSAFKYDAHFWTSTSDTSVNAWRYYIYQSPVVQRLSLSKTWGFSIRFLKDYMA